MTDINPFNLIRSFTRISDGSVEMAQSVVGFEDSDEFSVHGEMEVTIRRDREQML